MLKLSLIRQPYCCHMSVLVQPIPVSRDQQNCHTYVIIHREWLSKIGPNAPTIRSSPTINFGVSPSFTQYKGYKPFVLWSAAEASGREQWGRESPPY